MNLGIDGTTIRVTQESLKEENTVFKETCMNTLIYQLTQSFKRTLRILLNEKITGFIHFQPKQHWDLVLDTVCKHKLLYVALLIMFMDGLYLGSDFRLSF